MRIAYFDTIAGVSGDMTLGALLSAGLPVDDLRRAISGLRLEGVEIDASHVQRHGIEATKVDVIVSVKQAHHRHLRDIVALIDRSSLSTRVKGTAKNIFSELARGEASVHNSSIDEVAFHEVGGLDSIVDIVGVACCLEKLGVDAVYSSPVKLGSGGFVGAAHGQLPIPAPAAVEILKSYPVVLTDVPFELTTPTGAAIIKTLSRGVLSAERMTIESIGYGAGTAEIPGVPNLLRVMLGTLDAEDQQEEIVVIETTIDDMNPEVYPVVMEKLLSQGARDAYLVPVVMKKGRPGVVLSVTVDKSKLDGAARTIFAETTTLGVRFHPASRIILKREERLIDSAFGTVKVKAVVHDGREKLVPEFEECKRISQSSGLPLLEVYRILEKGLG